MKQRQIALSFIAIVASVAILFSACRRINEATELGGGLIPPVDNINTFDTTLTVFAFNDTFGLVTDSLRINGAEEQFLGRINADPFFGKTDARMFFEMKPQFFKFAFADKWPDSLHLDSVVLILDHVETYGDTNTVQTINVYEINQGLNFRSDTNYLVRKNELTYSNLLGTKTFAPRSLHDSVKTRDGDTTTRQLRIRLFDAFGNRLLSYDSTGNGAYAGDSLFRERFKGFALQSMNSGNAVMGFNLYGSNSKLAIYYIYNSNVACLKKYDTNTEFFRFSSNAASANFVTRDYTGTPLIASLNNGAVPDPIIYIQNSPGTFATLKIPDLLTIPNRVVHRAELIVEQLYDISDSTFRPPDFLYLDAFDPTITVNPYKFRTIPYDLTLDPSTGALSLDRLGSTPQMTTDAFGNRIRVWKFNLSRYVQHVFTRTLTNYDLRLFAPLYVFEQFGIPPGTDQLVRIDVNPAIVKGRIRLHGNNSSTDPNPQRIRLRIVYSKL